MTTKLLTERAAQPYIDGALARKAHGSSDTSPTLTQIYLGLTQKCNRHCSFCVSRSYSSSNLTLSDVERLLADGVMADVKVVALTGAGEATVHPQFFDVLELILARKPDVVFKMNTSGVTLARPEMAKRLMSYPFSNITVSVNAATEETYRLTVGEGFPRVLEGLRNLVAARDLAGAHTSVEGSIVLSRWTLPELFDFVDLMADLNVDRAQGIYLMLHSPDMAADSPLVDVVASNRDMQRAAERARARGLTLDLPPPFRSSEHQGHPYQTASLPTMQRQHCVEPWSTVYVRPNGDVIPCPYTERTLGNIHRSSLAAVWNGAEYAELRGCLDGGNLHRQCRHCCGFNEGGSVDDPWSHVLERINGSEDIFERLRLLATGGNRQPP